MKVKFIKLTCYFDEKPIYIAVDKILYLYPILIYENDNDEEKVFHHTYITFGNHNFERVKETPDEIISKINSLY